VTVLEFSVRGSADGPFPGTFTEKGQVDLGPPAGPIGGEGRPLLRWRSRFEIVSQGVRITGRRSGGHESSVGSVCYDAPDTRQIVIVPLTTLEYEATIETNSGRKSDSGSGPATFSLLRFGTTTIPPEFHASFSSANTTGSADEIMSGEAFGAVGADVDIRGTCR
jgi:hypothetical protein